MKEDILRLRKEGKSYNKIKELLGCSKGTISYHCGAGQIAKTRYRALKNIDKAKERNLNQRAYLTEFSFRYKKLCKCKVCKNNNPIVLQYDHRDPKDKLTNIACMINARVSLSLLKTEIRKCDVLCANCHLMRTAIQQNFSQLKHIVL